MRLPIIWEDICVPESVLDQALLTPHHIPSHSHSPHHCASLLPGAGHGVPHGACGPAGRQVSVLANVSAAPVKLLIPLSILPWGLPVYSHLLFLSGCSARYCYD